MASQRELDELAAEYRQASGYVHQARKIIWETHHAAARITGTYGPTSPYGIDEQMDELTRNLSRAYITINAAKPDRSGTD